MGTARQPRFITISLCLLIFTKGKSMAQKLLSTTLIGTVSFIATHLLVAPIAVQGAEVFLIS